jgi:transposase
MKYYSGLDVSLKTTFISVVDGTGKVVKEGEVETDVCSISSWLGKTGLSFENIGIESGQLSIPLCKGLRANGFNVTCVDARHMASALSARINKNDKNDGRGIAQMMRVNLYKEVLIKSDEMCELKVLLGSRKQLVGSRKQVMGTIRGLLKVWGMKISTSKKKGGFIFEVREKIKSIDEISNLSIEALLSALETIEKSLAKINKTLAKESKENGDSQLLVSAPGVGPVTSLTYLSTIDDASRFEESETVGAYIGLTPRQYASGEVDRHGGISKMGPSACRSLLYEAAIVLLTGSKKKSKLKAWGLRLAKKKGMKKAAVAVARKLAVIMHRMLVERTEFRYT